jgi:hypothetical protein
LKEFKDASSYCQSVSLCFNCNLLGHLSFQCRALVSLYFHIFYLFLFFFLICINSSSIFLMKNYNRFFINYFKKNKWLIEMKFCFYISQLCSLLMMLLNNLISAHCYVLSNCCSLTNTLSRPKKLSKHSVSKNQNHDLASKITFDSRLQSKKTIF